MGERLKHYPTKNGIAVNPEEIWLPPTYLDCEQKGNTNLHHNEWTARQFGRSILYLTLRNLSSNQFYMPIDQHEFIHRNYDTPIMPTPKQAIDEIERAYWEKEYIRTRENGHYVQHELTKMAFNLCANDYSRFRS